MGEFLGLKIIKAGTREDMKCQNYPERTPKQQADIQAIKDAHKKVREEKAEKGTEKRGRKQMNIDDNVIVQRMDRNGETASDIDREYGCSQQTIMNHYKKAKGLR